jgi:tRNA pseudouridine55 synthase
MNGFINLLKPIGPTSFQAVSSVKRIMGGKKAGHIGTLDPGAAGVLPICLGKATKLASLLTETKKIYRAEITFGMVTDTQDLQGKILKRSKANVSRQEIENLLKEFRGKQMETPPMYSAVKHRGKRLYQLAREGLEVERRPRNIEVFGIELLDYFSPDRAIIQVECSKGTYIRTLCHDIGARVGCGAVMSCLVRLYTGGFSLDNAITIEELEIHAQRGTLQSLVLPLDYPLQDMPRVIIREDALRFALNGNPLYKHNIHHIMGDLENGQRVRLYHRYTMFGIGIFSDDGQVPCIRTQKLLTDARSPEDIIKQV